MNTKRSKLCRRRSYKVGLIREGYLLAPLQLTKEYKGHNFEAVLRTDGKVEIESHVFDSCSAAADSVRSDVVGRRMYTNGWRFWSFRDSDGDVVSLEKARLDYIRDHDV
jgi:hypothetical protein